MRVRGRGRRSLLVDPVSRSRGSARPIRPGSRPGPPGSGRIPGGHRPVPPVSRGRRVFSSVSRPARAAFRSGLSSARLIHGTASRGVRGRSREGRARATTAEGGDEPLAPSRRKGGKPLPDSFGWFGSREQPRPSSKGAVITNAPRDGSQRVLDGTRARAHGLGLILDGSGDPPANRQGHGPDRLVHAAEPYGHAPASPAHPAVQ